jgi:hypothetical protein
VATIGSARWQQHRGVHERLRLRFLRLSRLPPPARPKARTTIGPVILNASRKKNVYDHPTSAHSPVTTRTCPEPVSDSPSASIMSEEKERDSVFSKNADPAAPK